MSNSTMIEQRITLTKARGLWQAGDEKVSTGWHRSKRRALRELQDLRARGVDTRGMA